MKKTFKIALKKNKRNPLSDRAAEIVRCCKNKDYEILTVSWLAEQLGVTPEHLSRVFRRDYNSSLQRYIIRAKLDRAIDIVAKKPGIKMAELAEKLGYSSSGYLNKLCARNYFPSFKMFRDFFARRKKRKQSQEKNSGKENNKAAKRNNKK